MQEENCKKGGRFCFSSIIIMELRRGFGLMNIDIETLKWREELLCVLGKAYIPIQLWTLQ